MRAHIDEGTGHPDRGYRLKIQDGATLRCEGILEFITVYIRGMLGKLKLLRPATAAENL